MKVGDDDHHHEEEEEEEGMNNFTSNLFTWQTRQVITILLYFCAKVSSRKKTRIAMTTPAVECITNLPFYTTINPQM
jgi:hypothetical protein